MQLFKVQGKNNNKKNISSLGRWIFTSGAQISKFQSRAAFYFGGMKKKRKELHIVWLTVRPEQFGSISEHLIKCFDVLKCLDLTFKRSSL